MIHNWWINGLSNKWSKRLCLALVIFAAVVLLYSVPMNVYGLIK